MTNGAKINGGITKKLQILVAPLDWGLGHATRCIPIINHFLEQGHEVVVAATGQHGDLLRQEFPALESINLQGYDLSYSSKNQFNKWKIFFILDFRFF